MKWIIFTKEFENVFVPIGSKKLNGVLDMLTIRKDVIIEQILPSPYKGATIRIFWRELK